MLDFDLEVGCCLVPSTVDGARRRLKGAQLALSPPGFNLTFGLFKFCLNRFVKLLKSMIPCAVDIPALSKK